MLIKYKQKYQHKMALLNLLNTLYQHQNSMISNLMKDIELIISWEKSIRDTYWPYRDLIIYSWHILETSKHIIDSTSTINKYTIFIIM